MIQIIVLVIGLLAIAGGSWAWLHNHDNAVEAAYQAQIDAKEAELKIAADRAKQEQQNKEIDMEAAYEAGQEKSRVIYRTVYKNAEAQTTRAEFVSAPCVMDAGSLQLLNSARASLRLSPAALEANGGMPSPGGPVAGRPVQDPLPAAVPRPASDSGVPGPAQSTGSGNQGPGRYLQTHPKPVPIGKQ